MQYPVAVEVLQAKEGLQGVGLDVGRGEHQAGVLDDHLGHGGAGGQVITFDQVIR